MKRETVEKEAKGKEGRRKVKEKRAIDRVREPKKPKVRVGF